MASLGEGWVRMRRLLAVVGSISLMMVFTTPVIASQSGYEGDPQFPLFGSCKPAQASKEVEIGITLVNHSLMVANAEVHVRLPKGWKLVSGDTVIRGVISRDELRWPLVVRVGKPGRHQVFVRAVALVGGERKDETDMRIDLYVGAEATKCVGSGMTRVETIRAGQRYRYARLCLVPIEAPEPFIQNELNGPRGNRAVPIRRFSVVCAQCTPAERAPVQTRVIVDQSGRVMSVEVKDRLSRELTALVEEAALKWRFKPATMDGIPVRDHAFIRVQVY